MLHPIVLKLLQARGLANDQVPDFLSDDLRQLPELTSLIDIQKAASRLCQAMERKEKIGVFGDYDVDGTTSCALLHFFFQSLNYPITLIQPSRFVEGYGIHPPSVEEAKEAGIQVLMTVDCGITADKAAIRASELGIDLIITDHHQEALEQLPQAFAIVNPNRRDEPLDSPLRALAGVGVAFALCLAIKKQLEQTGHTVPSLYSLLSFVAIGTIADLAQLTPVNLKLCRHGLRLIKNTPFIGIKTFFTSEELSLPTIDSERIAFHVGPLINAKGRLDHPEAALKLLISQNIDEAKLLYHHLKECNQQRKFLTNEVFTQAKAQALSSLSGTRPELIIVYQSDWHEGIVGIVASKLVDAFKVPAIVLTDSTEQGMIKGSARSAGEMSIFELIKTSENLLSKFGGHKGAAGLSFKKENYPKFAQKLFQEIKKIPAILRTRVESYDLEISADDISVELLKDLEKLGPFGMGNPSPVFKIRGMEIASFDILKEVHVRWNLKSKKTVKQMAPFRGISFNFLGQLEALHPHELFKHGQSQGVDVTFGLGINRFNGKEYLQLQVSQVIPS